MDIYTHLCHVKQNVLITGSSLNIKRRGRRKVKKVGCKAFFKIAGIILFENFNIIKYSRNLFIRFADRKPNVSH